MEPDTTRFGAALRRLRLVAGFSQEALAERAGLSPRGIRALEAGHRTSPRPETLRLLANALDLDDAARTELIAAARPELTEPEAPVSSPPAPHHDLAPRPLPAPPTRLVGREREVAAICAVLRREDGERIETVDGRLVTLTGPGGVGKSRLALAVARELAISFDTTVWLELAQLHGQPKQMRNLLATAIAQAVGTREATGQPSIRELIARLGQHHLLLVLDSFEHILPAASLVSDLLAACPNLSVLVTSRERLRLGGEREVQVSPLAWPELTAGADGREVEVAELASVAAVRLFVDRATAVQPSFVLTAANAPAVAGICQRLDGLPLAIELAASRAKLLTPAELLALLDRQRPSRLPLLKGGSRDVPARQQTMRDAIAWSYDLLSQEEQSLFRQLAVFAGGCNLRGVEAVCDATGTETDAGALPGLGASGVIDGMASLVDKSLLRRVQPGATDGSGLRFTMLETIREFGCEQLAASGEEAGARDRHAAWCLELAERVWRATTHGPVTETWLDRIDTERDNLRAALEWLEQSDAVRFVRLAGVLWPLWLYRGNGLEGRDWLDRALAHESVPGPFRLRALHSAAVVAWSMGEVTRMAGLYRELHSVAITLDDPWGIAAGRYGLGEAALFRGEYEAAAVHLNEARGLFAEQGNQGWVAFTVHRLGLVAHAQGVLGQAEVLQEESLALHQEFGDPLGTAMSRDALGAIACDRGDLSAAAVHYQASLALWEQVGTKDGLAFWLTGVGVLAAAAGVTAQATRLIGAATVLRQASASPLRPPWRQRRDRAIASARTTLGIAAFHDAEAAGMALTLPMAIRVAQAVLESLSGH